MEHLVALSSVNIIPRSKKVTCICHLPSGDHHQGWTKVSVVLSTARLDFGFGFFSNLKNHFRVFQNLLSYSSGHHHYLHLSSAIFNFSTLPNLKSADKTWWCVSWWQVRQAMKKVLNLAISGASSVLSVGVLVPSLFVCLCLLLMLISINLGVFASLFLCSARVDVVTSLAALLSIGYSIDYTNHLLVHYHSSNLG